MFKDALFGGVNAAVLTADARRPVGRPRPHGGALPLAARQWLQRAGILGTTGEANSLGVAGAHRADGGPGRARHAGRAHAARHRHARPSRHRAADPRAPPELGCRGVLLLPPFFYKNPSDDGLFAYFSEVIQRAGGGAADLSLSFPGAVGGPVHRRPDRPPAEGVSRHGARASRTAAAISPIPVSYVRAFAATGSRSIAATTARSTTLLKIGGAGCITAASNVSCAHQRAVYANWDKPSRRRRARDARRDRAGRSPRRR